MGEALLKLTFFSTKKTNPSAAQLLVHGEDFFYAPIPYFSKFFSSPQTLDARGDPTRGERSTQRRRSSSLFALSACF